MFLTIWFVGSVAGLREYLGIEEEEKFACEICHDTGFIEVLGDGENFECDVIGHKRCVCQED